MVRLLSNIGSPVPPQPSNLLSLELGPSGVPAACSGEMAYNAAVNPTNNAANRTRKKAKRAMTRDRRYSRNREEINKADFGATELQGWERILPNGRNINRWRSPTLWVRLTIKPRFASSWHKRCRGVPVVRSARSIVSRGVCNGSSFGRTIFVFNCLQSAS